MELIFRLSALQRVGGWCKPMGTDGKVSLRSRATESSKSLRLAPLSWQRACLSSVRWSIFSTTGVVPRYFSSPRHFRLGAFLCCAYNFSFLIDLFFKKGRGFGQRPKKRHFLFAKPFLLGLLRQKKRRQRRRRRGQCRRSLGLNRT